MTTPETARTPHPVTGVLVGLACGLFVLVAYFVQASWGSGGLFWNVFVLPAFATLFIGSLVAAAACRDWRNWWLGVAGGVALMVPLCIAGFIFLLVTIGFE